MNPQGILPQGLNNVQVLDFSGYASRHAGLHHVDTFWKLLCEDSRLLCNASGHAGLHHVDTFWKLLCSNHDVILMQLTQCVNCWNCINTQTWIWKDRFREDLDLQTSTSPLDFSPRMRLFAEHQPWVWEPKSHRAAPIQVLALS